MMLSILYVPVLCCQVLSSEIDIAFGWASITKLNRADWSLFLIVLKTLLRIGLKVLVLMSLGVKGQLPSGSMLST